MITQNYLIIEENVVTNICVWDGDTNTWQPPIGATMLFQESTPAMVWQYDSVSKQWVLFEIMGAADIGFTWNGTVCITNQPEPTPMIASINQPTTSGTTTI